MNVISLEREIPRHWRFESEDDEQKLLDAANPHLRAVLTAMLDTAARPGEILSLQWGDVNLETSRVGVSRGEDENPDRAYRADFNATPWNAGDEEIGPCR